MKAKTYLSLSILALALASCSTVQRKIPVGIYRQSGTTNFIRVLDERAQVHIEGVDKRDANGAGLTFKYVLWSDGQLWLVVARSAELTYGYPALNYFWDGNTIVATNAATGARWEFTLQDRQ